MRRCAVWLTLAIGFAARGQDAGTIHLKVETRAVQMNVAVKDAAGRPVRDLRKEDFTILDSGKRREIALFSGEEEAAAPARPAVELPPNVFSNRYGATASPGRVTAILIDALNTEFEHQSYAREQAMKAVARMSPGESIALYAMTPDLAILQDYTTDRDLLLQAIRAYLPRPPMTSGPGGRGIAQMLMRRRVEGSLESLQLIASKMGSASGRKSIVWVTAAFPPNADDNRQIESTLRKINDANVAIYPVDARGLLPSRNAMINIFTMQRFAEETGGHAYYNRNDLDQALVEAVEDSRYTYSLGFYLSESDLDGRFHELKLKVARPGVVLHYRRGYSATQDQQESRKSRKVPKEELAATMLNPVDSADIGIDAKLEKTGDSLRVRLVVGLTEAGEHSLNWMLVETDARGYMLSDPRA